MRVFVQTLYRKVKQKYSDFIKELREANAFPYLALVVVIDGNCKGVKKRIRDFSSFLNEQDLFTDQVIYAVPDPHIEKWYMMDQKALKLGIGLRVAPQLPPHKCKKNYYKDKLYDAIQLDLNSEPESSGSEYAEDIVNNINNIYRFAQLDEGCKRFIDDLRALVKQVKTE